MYRNKVNLSGAFWLSSAQPKCRTVVMIRYTVFSDSGGISSSQSGYLLIVITGSLVSSISFGFRCFGRFVSLLMKYRPPMGQMDC